MKLILKHLAGTGKTVNYVQITGEQLVAAIPIPDETFKHSILQMYMSNAEFGCKL